MKFSALGVSGGQRGCSIPRASWGSTIGGCSSFFSLCALFWGSGAAAPVMWVGLGLSGSMDWRDMAFFFCCKHSVAVGSLFRGP